MRGKVCKDYNRKQYGYQCGKTQYYSKNLLTNVTEYKVLNFNYGGKIYINDVEFANVENAAIEAEVVDKILAKACDGEEKKAFDELVGRQ